MTQDIEKYNSLLSLAFKVILLLFMIGLIGTFFYAFIVGDIWDKLLTSGVTVGGIAGIFKIYIKYEIATNASKDPDNFDAETIKEIIKSMSGSANPD